MELAIYLYSGAGSLNRLAIAVLILVVPSSLARVNPEKGVAFWALPVGSNVGAEVLMVKRRGSMTWDKNIKKWP